MRALLLLAALVACDNPAQVDRIAGSWRMQQAPHVELHITEQLEAAICVPVLGPVKPDIPPLEIATAIWERDAFDAYHLRVAAIDPALADRLPLPLLQALDVDALDLLVALANVDYALRFCRRDDSTLACESLLGERYTTWETTEHATCERSVECLAPPTPIQREILDCMLRVTSPLCTVLTAPELASELDRCIVKEVLDLPMAQSLYLEHGCNALVALEREDRTETVLASCDQLPEPDKTVGNMLRALVAGSPADQIVDNVRKVCLEKARLVGHALACCG